MIVEFVQFKRAPGVSREEVLADARTTIPKWRANDKLIRKHFLAGDDDMLGAFYIWPTREDAERAHDDAWRQAVIKRSGAPPVIRYFDLTMIIDNTSGEVTEFAADETQWAK